VNRYLRISLFLFKKNDYCNSQFNELIAKLLWHLLVAKFYLVQMKICVYIARSILFCYILAIVPSLNNERLIFKKQILNKPEKCLINLPFLMDIFDTASAYTRIE
jgi:hypothetical protein